MVIAVLMFVGAIALVLWDLTTRRLAERLARVQQPGRCAGRAFDVGAVRPRVCSLRADYIAALQSRTPDSDYHQELIQSARETIAKLPFFQRRRDVGLTPAE